MLVVQRSEVLPRHSHMSAELNWARSSPERCITPGAVGSAAQQDLEWHVFIVSPHSPTTNREYGQFNLPKLYDVSLALIRILSLFMCLSLFTPKAADVRTLIYSWLGSTVFLAIIIMAVNSLLSAPDYHRIRLRSTSLWWRYCRRCDLKTWHLNIRVHFDVTFVFMVTRIKTLTLAQHGLVSFCHS